MNFELRKNLGDDNRLEEEQSVLAVDFTLQQPWPFYKPK